MDGDVQPREIREISDEYPFEKFYLLDVTDEISFGFFYVGPDICTLGWQGIFDFLSLDQEARYTLRRIIEREWKLKRTANMPDTADVSLVLKASGLPEYELREYHLPEESDMYQSDLSQPKDISFARYDVSTLFQSQYSFTAENPLLSSTSSSELTILLPRSHRWSTELLDWVIDHHKYKDRLKEIVHPEAASKILSDLSDRS